jgi:hypothetical protein
MAMARGWNALTAGVNEAKRVWDSPGKKVPAIGTRGPLFDAYWAYFSNTAFDVLDGYWQAYKAQNGLNRFHRSIINPWFRLSKFYVGAVYGAGGLSFDGKPLPEGIRNAIPLAEDTAENILIGTSQLMRWSNWLVGKNLQVQNAAAVGCSCIEVVLDNARGHVMAEHHWPGHMKDMDNDGQGNIKSAVLEWDIIEKEPQAPPKVGEKRTDAKYRTYKFRKEMVGGDNGYIATFKDGQLWDPSGTGSGLQENPWGFVPIVWVQHEDIGTGFGLPAGWAIQGKIDQINDMASLLFDQVQKIVKMPILLQSNKQMPQEITPRNTQATNQQIMTEQDAQKGREEVPFIEVGMGGGAVLVPLDIAQGMETLAVMIEELEKDTPELSMWSQARQSGGDTTGEGMDRQMGDINGRYIPIMQTHDMATTKWLQMGMTMAGWAINAGLWGPRGRLTKDQLKFADFTLDSYKAGELDFDIVPRPLISPSELKAWQVKQTKALAIQAMKDLGLFPDAMLLEEWGIPEDEVQGILDAATQQGQDKMELAMAAFDRGQVPGVPQGASGGQPGQPGGATGPGQPGSQPQRPAPPPPGSNQTRPPAIPPPRG